MIKLKATSNRY